MPDVAIRGNYTDEPAAIPTYSGRSLRYIGASFPDVRCGSNVSFCASASLSGPPQWTDIARPAGWSGASHLRPAS